jgi:hypothetical protein
MHQKAIDAMTTALRGRGDARRLLSSYPALHDVGDLTPVGHAFAAAYVTARANGDDGRTAEALAKVAAGL